MANALQIVVSDIPSRHVVPKHTYLVMYIFDYVQIMYISFSLLTNFMLFLISHLFASHGFISLQIPHQSRQRQKRQKNSNLPNK